MAKVESFSLNHNKVIAPYVRQAANEIGDNGDIITKFDIRLVQPNQDALPTGALHTLEHLFAAYIRDYVDGVIDISPMGCRTGFYFIVWGDHSAEEIADATKNVLEHVVDSEWADVQGVAAVACGNYRDHSLFGAKEYASQVLAAGISSDPYERKVV